MGIELSDVAIEIASQMDLPHVREVAVKRVAELCAADGATLFLVDPATGELCFDVVEGSGANALRHLRLPAGEGIAGRAAAEGRPFICERASESPDFARRSDEVSGFRTGSVIAAPVVFGNETLGVLEAVRAQGREAFADEQLAVLVSLAPHVAAAMQHARTEDALRTSRAALVRSNEELEARVDERTALLSRAKREWESTFDAIQDPIVVLDGFTVRRANLRFQAATGRKPWGELIGKPCYAVLAGRSSPCEGCPLATTSAAPSAGEVTIGSATLQVSTWAMSVAETGPARVVHYRDVTEQRALALRLMESERLAVVGQLASGAAHEINNPLSLLLSNLDLLRETLGGSNPDPDMLQLLDEALAGSRRIGDVVKSLRLLSRQESGRPEPTLLSAAVERAVRRALGESTRATVELASRRSVVAPPTQLDAAVVHLVKNARQAVPDERRIRVRTFDEGEMAVLEVSDSGCGIAPEHLPHVFEPFFTTRRVGEGQGLGLAVTYGVVRRAGGDVSIESALGQGTTVTARFPTSATSVAAAGGAGRYAPTNRGSSSGLYAR